MPGTAWTAATMRETPLPVRSFGPAFRRPKLPHGRNNEFGATGTIRVLLRSCGEISYRQDHDGQRRARLASMDSVHGSGAMTGTISVSPKQAVGRWTGCPEERVPTDRIRRRDLDEADSALADLAYSTRYEWHASDECPNGTDQQQRLQHDHERSVLMTMRASWKAVCPTYNARLHSAGFRFGTPMMRSVGPAAAAKRRMAEGDHRQRPCTAIALDKRIIGMAADIDLR